MQGGLTVAASGLGVSIMLAAIAPKGIWTVGLILVFVGVVIFTFAWFSKPLDGDAAVDAAGE